MNSCINSAPKTIFNDESMPPSKYSNNRLLHMIVIWSFKWHFLRQTNLPRSAVLFMDSCINSPAKNIPNHESIPSTKYSDKRLLHMILRWTFKWYFLRETNLTRSAVLFVDSCTFGCFNQLQFWRSNTHILVLFLRHYLINVYVYKNMKSSLAPHRTVWSIRIVFGSRVKVNFQCHIILIFPTWPVGDTVHDNS